MKRIVACLVWTIMPDPLVSVNLVDFLSTGRFGPLAFGMTPEQLQDVLGPVEMAGPLSAQEILKYGAIEFHFRDHGLCGIHAEQFDALAGDGRLHIEPGWVCWGLRREEAQHSLRAAGISWHEAEDLYNPGMVQFTLESGVGLLFVVEEEKADLPLGLCLLGCWRR